MLHIFAETYVGYYKEVRELLLQLTEGSLNNSIGGVGSRCFRILPGRNAKQQHGVDPCLLRLLGLAKQLIRRQLKYPGHGADRPPHFAAFAHEQGQHQLIPMQPCLANEAAQSRRFAQPPRTICGESSAQIHSGSLRRVKQESSSVIFLVTDAPCLS